MLEMLIKLGYDNLLSRTESMSFKLTELWLKIGRKKDWEWCCYRDRIFGSHA